MEHLYIDKSPHTPEVYFNIDDSKLCIIGRSFPEDAAQFYMPIMSWLENNIQEFENGFAIDVQLEYYNTSSSKYLLKMFYFLEKYHEEHNYPVKVIWKYPSNDEDMKNAGLEYQQFVGVPFEFVAID